jgi:preprotein translocase subunit SecG
MNLVTLIQIIWAVSAAFLIVLVLLHSPKGDGLGGIGGQAQLFTSAKSAEKTLNQVTWTLATTFVALTIVLSAGWLNTSANVTPPSPSTVSPTTPPTTPTTPVTPNIPPEIPSNPLP